MQNTLMFGLVSLWLGFAVAHQVSFHAAIDAKHPGGGNWRFWVGRIIFASTALAGMLGLTALIASRNGFANPAFTIGLVAGVLLFLVARKLLAEKQ
jgi:hypothetical protein